jgi:hypothetical protein
MTQAQTVVSVETNNFTNGDPLFVDYAKGNFALLTNSPAWALGFQPIPLSRIGLGLLPPQELKVISIK